MATVDLNKNNFEEKVTSSDITMIDFWAPWCGPCKAFGPTYEAVSAEHEDVLFAKVNTEDEQELGAQFNIRSIPTLMIIRENIVVFSQAGALPKAALQDLIGQVKALDMDEIRAEVAKEQAA
ncbi:MAG: thioredoxin [Zetaproteobacteria bacterium CG2_30_46_52]|nr:MAG: thioredoxin [Zetaproteobacteria bacterium CG2_30_46_52]